MTAPNPALVAERDRRLAVLGPQPSWWRFFARRRWRRERAAILAMDVSEMAALLRRLYPSDTIEKLAQEIAHFGTRTFPIRRPAKATKV